MPANKGYNASHPKEGLDLKAMEEAYRGGAAQASIAQNFGISRQRVGQLAKKHGWANQLSARQVKTGVIKRPCINLLTDREWGKMNAHNIDLILAWVARGIPLQPAVKMTGIPLRTFYNHMATDKGLASQVEAVRAIGEADTYWTMTEAMERGDYKAAVDRLKLNPDNKEQYGEKGQSSGKTTIVLNVPRDAETVTIEHEG